MQESIVLRQPVIAALSKMAGKGGQPFAIRDWILSERGVLFIPYRAAHREALGPLLSAWLLLAIMAATTLQKSASRLWVVVSEADALRVVGSSGDFFGALLGLSRCDTGTFVMGYETITRLHALYKDLPLDPILESCGHRLIFKCSGETAEFASKLVHPRSVLPSEMSHLPDSVAYLQFDVGEWRRVRFSG